MAKRHAISGRFPPFTKSEYARIKARMTRLVFLRDPIVLDEILSEPTPEKIVHATVAQLELSQKLLEEENNEIWEMAFDVIERFSYEFGKKHSEWKSRYEKDLQPSGDVGSAESDSGGEGGDHSDGRHTETD